MSKECIVLSSDEEIQIIGEIKEDIHESNNVFKNSKLANTIKRFSGNSNVELTIKLEDDTKEINNTAPVNQNGKICKNKSSDQKNLHIWETPEVKTRSPSPKIYLIEDDTPKPTVMKLNQTKPSEISHPPMNSLNSKTPASVDQANSTPIKAYQKSTTPFVSNEILIIEDNSDENSDDDCKILSTSIIGPSEDPLLIKEQTPNPTQNKVPIPRKIRCQEGIKGASPVKTLINQPLSIVNGRIVRRKTLENKENTLVNAGLCKSRESVKNTGQIRPSVSNARSRQSSAPSTSFSAAVTSKNVVHTSPSSTSNAIHKSSLEKSNRNREHNFSSSASNSKNPSPTNSASSNKKLPEENNLMKHTFNELVQLCDKIFEDKELTSRLWRYYNEASEDIVKSDDFHKALEIAITGVPLEVKSMQQKIIISRNVKEVIRLLKRQPSKDTRKLRKLNRMLVKISERIRKLEDKEVTSDEDEDEENIYVILDRHRARAAKIYNKICELEGKAAHAGRAFLQKFNFSGTSQYPKIEHALEKYFNKTRIFPDFYDVKKLIEATVEKEKYHISPKDVHNMAQSLFVEFGDKLQRRRQYDDYTSLVDYLDDGTEDPANSDEQLKIKLEENKKFKKKEQEVFEEYTRKQAEFKMKEPEEVKTDVNDTEDDEEEEGPIKKIIQFTDTEEELLKTEDEASRKRTREIVEENEINSKRNKSSSDPEEVLTINEDSCSNTSGDKKDPNIETESQFCTGVDLESIL